MNKHKSFVTTFIPSARCRRDPPKGPGISYGIVAKGIRLTNGWMTPDQAWERMGAALMSGMRPNR